MVTNETLRAQRVDRRCVGTARVPAKRCLDQKSDMQSRWQRRKLKVGKSKSAREESKRDLFRGWR